jgi:hypothetical protein
MASSPQRNHAFIYDRKIASHNKSHIHVAYNDSHAMFASSSTFVHGRSRPRRRNVAPHVPRRMCNEPSEREMCPWAISKCFGDLVSNTSA